MRCPSGQARTYSGASLLPAARDPISQAHGFVVPFPVNRDLKGIAQLLLLSPGDIPLLPFSKWLVGTECHFPLGARLVSCSIQVSQPHRAHQHLRMSMRITLG